MANKSIYDAMKSIGEITSLPGQRYDDFMEQTQRFQEGEIGYPDQMLMGGANALGMLTDIPYAIAGKGTEIASDAVGSMLPELVTKGYKDLKQGIKETDAAKATMQWMKENPQWMKRLGYAADLAVAPAGKTVRDSVIPDLSLEANNRQPWFYGSGIGGKLASIGVTAPKAVVNALNPFSSASRRGGIPTALRDVADSFTPERIKEAARIENKDKSERTTEESNSLRNYRKDLSFLEGQLDQTQLLNRGRGVESQNVVGAFEKVQQLHAGTLNFDVLKAAISFSSLKKKNIELTNDNLGVIEERIRKDQGIETNEKVEVVVRNPNAFSRITRESFKGLSKSATRIFYAKDSLKRHFPEKENFTDAELKEFVSLTRLPDDSLYRLKDGKPANVLEKKFFAFTENKKFGTKGRSPKDTIDMFYKYKKIEADGKNLTKPQQKIYDGMKARIQLVSETLDQRGDTIYFSGSHNSSAKGLGGVNDQFMVDRRGNFVHFLNDENDLFGQVVPGDSRVLSIAPPNGYNVFNYTKESAPSQKPPKQVFQSELAELGSPPVNQQPSGMLQQAAVAIQNQEKPRVRPTDFKNAAAVSALASGGPRDSMLTDAPSSAEYLASFGKRGP